MTLSNLNQSRKKPWLHSSVKGPFTRNIEQEIQLSLTGRAQRRQERNFEVLARTDSLQIVVRNLVFAKMSAVLHVVANCAKLHKIMRNDTVEWGSCNSIVTTSLSRTVSGTFNVE